MENAFMSIRCFLLILISLLSGCRHAQQPSPVFIQPVSISTQQIRSLPAFTQIQAQGQLNVRLRTGFKRSQVILHGDPRDVAQVTTQVIDNALILNLGAGYPRFGPVSAEIRSHYLNEFKYSGAGRITGSQIHSGLLDLSIDNAGATTLGGSINLRRLKVAGAGNVTITGASSQGLQLSMSGSPRVSLNGFVNLTQLNVEGDGYLSLYWIKSDWLTIRAQDHAVIQLAGIVNKLDVKLCDFAQFHGRFLRAKRAFVKTLGHSVAEISSIDRQHSLASDASNIYFYNLPEMKTDFMAFDGSVLDMRDWGTYSLQEYTVLNKQLQ